MGTDCMLIAKHKGKQEFTTVWLDRLYYFGDYGDSIDGIKTDIPLNEMDLRNWVEAVKKYAEATGLSEEKESNPHYPQFLEHKLKLIIKFLDSLTGIDVEYIVLSDDSGGKYYDLVLFDKSKIEHQIDL